MLARSLIAPFSFPEISAPRIVCVQSIHFVRESRRSSPRVRCKIRTTQKVFNFVVFRHERARSTPETILMLFSKLPSGVRLITGTAGGGWRSTSETLEPNLRFSRVNRFLTEQTSCQIQQVHLLLSRIADGGHSDILRIENLNQFIKIVR